MPLEVEIVALRSGTTADWNASGLILGLGELGVDTTAQTLKLGNGTDLFANLDAL